MGLRFKSFGAEIGGDDERANRYNRHRATLAASRITTSWDAADARALDPAVSRRACRESRSQGDSADRSVALSPESKHAMQRTGVVRALLHRGGPAPDYTRSHAEAGFAGRSAWPRGRAGCWLGSAESSAKHCAPSRDRDR